MKCLVGAWLCILSSSLRRVVPYYAGCCVPGYLQAAVSDRTNHGCTNLGMAAFGIRFLKRACTNTQRPLPTKPVLMSHELSSKLLKGGLYKGFYRDHYMGVTRGDTRSLDYGSHQKHFILQEPGGKISISQVHV